MFTIRLFKIIGHFRGSVNFHPKAKILSSKNIILNRAFLCTAQELPNSTEVKPKLRPQDSYYRQYLLHNSAYENYLFIPGTNKNSKVAALLRQLQEENENNLNIQNELSEYLEREIPRFSFNEFCEVLFMVQYFIQVKPPDPCWQKITTLLDDECFHRIPTLSKDEIVKMTDAILQLKKSLWSIGKLYLKLLSPSLNIHQIILLFYFLWRKKFNIPKEEQFNLQERVIKILPKVNSTELGIIADGLLKICTSLRNPDIIPAILKKALEEIDSIDEIPFNTICRFASALSNIVHIDLIAEFQEKAIDTAVKFGAEKVIGLALTGEKYNYLHPNLRTKVMKEIKDQIKEVSPYFIERVAYLTVKFNIQDDEFLKLAIDEFENKEFSLWNRRTLVHFLHCLIHHKTYPKKLLDLILEEDFIDQLSGLSFVFSWWQIYCTLEIEKPEYRTHDLTPKQRKSINQLGKLYLERIHPKHYKYLWYVKENLEQVFGEGTVNIFVPLPHYPTGLLMRFDKNLQPQKLPSDFILIRKGEIVKPLQDDHIWLFLMLGYTHYLCDNSQPLPNLILQTEFRQLSTIGYTPVPVYGNFTRIKEDQKESFENLIKAKLEESCKYQKIPSCN